MTRPRLSRYIPIDITIIIKKAFDEHLPFLVLLNSEILLISTQIICLRRMEEHFKH